MRPPAIYISNKYVLRMPATTLSRSFRFAILYAKNANTNFDVHGPAHRTRIFKCNQHDATSYNLFISVKCSTCFRWFLRPLSLILRRSRTGTVWFYTSTSNKGAARPKLYTKSLTRDLKCMYSRFTLVRISINL